MRDLARQGFANKDRSFSKIFKILILIVAISAGFIFFRDQIISGGILSVSSTLRDAPKGLTPVDVGDETIDAGEGISLTTQKATFTDVSGENNKAQAVRKFGDGNYTLSVQATLADPKGHKYQVWIIAPDGKVFDAGFMNGSGNLWTLTFRDKDYYSKYNEVWITRELTVQDGKPEKHILEGSF